MVHLDFSLDEHLFKESAKTNDECPWKRGREFLCSSIHHPEKGLHKIMGKTPLWGCVRETYIIPQKPYLNLKCGGETEKLIPSLKLTVSLHLKSWMVGIRSFPFGGLPCHAFMVDFLALILEPRWWFRPHFWGIFTPIPGEDGSNFTVACFSTGWEKTTN